MAAKNEKDTQGNAPENTFDMEALKAEMMAELKDELKAEMLDDVKAELKDELIAEQKAKGEPAPMTEEEIKYWNEPVTYDAPYIEGKDDIVVGHNGKLYKIKRGETVTIPRCVKDILVNSEKQKMDFAKVKKGLENQEL